MEGGRVMSKKPVIILADANYEYLSALELRFAELYKNTIELEVITEKDFFEAVFSRQQQADVLLIDERWYSSGLLRHDISRIVILTEHADHNHAPSGNSKTELISVNKYSNLKNIVHESMHSIRFAEGKHTAGTQVIGVTSAIGGSGKTSAALGLASCLSHNHHRVCYLSTKEIQTFSWYLGNKGTLTSDACKILREIDTIPFSSLKPHLRTEEFTYLPPFALTLDALGLSFKCYTGLVSQLKQSGNFDYIIVDMDGSLDGAHTALWQQCDRMIILVLQDYFSAEKTSFLLKNADCQDNEKYLFVCNRYDETKENCLISVKSYKVSAYIKQLQDLPSINQLSNSKGIEELMWMLS